MACLAARAYFWHFGHQYVARCPITAERIGVPQALHGSPARPYTNSSCSK
jgi:hypothetical protein